MQAPDPQAVNCVQVYPVASTHCNQKAKKGQTGGGWLWLNNGPREIQALSPGTLGVACVAKVT